MNKKEATKIIEEELSNYKSKSYSELREMIGEQPVTKDINSQTGTKYQTEIIAYWDYKQEGDIRVLGAIDDMGLRAYSPLVSSFIMSPEGRLIDE